MATFRNRNGKWQARVQIKDRAEQSRTFINKADAERWAKQIEVEIQKRNYTNHVLAGCGEKSVMSQHLTDIESHCNIFYKQLKPRPTP